MKRESLLLKYGAGIIMGIILNVVPMYFVQYVLKLPFFMDTIGSIAVAFALGGIPAIICAVLTEFVLFFIEQYISWIVMLYGLTVWTSIGIVVIIKKSIVRSESISSVIIYLFITSILMAIAVSVTGGIVNTFDDLYQTARGITGDFNSATSFFRADLMNRGFGLLGTNIFARIPSNLIERPVTTFAAYGLAYLYQRKCGD